MLLPVTLTIAAAAALLNIWLAMRAGRTRMAAGVLIGDGGDQRLIARMRSHANFVEYAPFFLILLALVELAGGSTQWLWTAGIVFILARILHPFGMDKGTTNWMRAVGILGTLVALLALAVYALLLTYRLV